LYIYIHVPFCASHCIYCDFYVELAKYGGMAAYVDTLLQEATQRIAQSPPPAGTQVTTVYFGGGTPSLLTAAHIDRILQHLNRLVPFSSKIEITLEANPEAWADQPLYYKKVGVNRLSIGAQSLLDPELTKLSRNHRASHVVDCLEDVLNAGFQNVSLDLMYGIPGQTVASWQQTLTRMRELTPQLKHISFYGLHVEEDTPLAQLVKHPQFYPMPTDDDTVTMFEQGVEQFKQQGFTLYEFSNLAKPGFESKHNLNYWHNGEYLALGPGAHGYWHGQRYETVRDFTQWLGDPFTLAQPAYHPDEQEQWETALMVGLRLREGLSLHELEARYGVDVKATCQPVWDKFADYFWFKDDRFGLKPAAIPISNTILAEFIADAD
jgi:oxygen-independent coproporphyrinogen III oxidase